MRNEIVRTRDFSRRALVLGTGKLALFSALIGRLYYLQVMESDKYSTMAEGNRIRLYPILPSRGKILDRNGTILAEGIPRYQILFDPPQNNGEGAKRIEQLIDKISSILELSEEQKAKLIERVKNRKNGSVILIDDYVDWNKVAKIEVNAPDLPGVNVADPEVRNYPFGKDMAHIIGYTGLPSQKDIDDNILHRNPEFRIGKIGLEKTLEERLQGMAGIKQVEVNALGARIRELETNDGVPGEDVEISVDIDLQKFLREKLSGKGGLKTEGGSAVVLNVKTGEVMAMASVPSYDPNNFIRGISSKDWKELIRNPDNPLSNKTISMRYPPGSTFKPIVAAAGLEEGIITRKTKYFCPGYYKFGGRKFHCWNKHGHGNINVEYALMQSCNVFFYKLSHKLGVDNIAKMAKKFGLGSLTGIELGGEKPGIIPSKAWKLRTIGEKWWAGETLSVGIGQGYTLTTPLQLAVMAARIASDGRKIKPHIIKDNSPMENEVVVLDSGEKILIPKQGSPFGRIDVSKHSIGIVMKGMDMVVNDKRGLAYRLRLRDPEWSFAGKTGTAQVISKRRFEHVPKERAKRYHSLFIGFAPVIDPTYAISVVIEHGGYGSSVAAPMGRDIFAKIKELYG